MSRNGFKTQEVRLKPDATFGFETGSSRVWGLTRDEQEARLLELSETGQGMAAITLARRLYGYDLTQAKAFVDGLRNGKGSTGLRKKP